MKYLVFTTTFALVLASGTVDSQANASPARDMLTTGGPPPALRMPKTSQSSSSTNRPLSNALPSTVKNSTGEPSPLSVDSFYPAYCPFLLPNVSKDDWVYREALHICKYGS